MSIGNKQLDQATTPEIATTLQHAGIAGAGGAGFPAYAKWERLDEVPFLVVNHQESEPNYFMDRWLGRTYAEEFAEFFETLLDSAFEVITVAAKEKDRDEWIGDLESATDGTVYGPGDLPIDPADESGLVFAYTEDAYEYGMESVLLRMVADVLLRDELPMDHGWMVQNTETMFNVKRTFEENSPVTRKFVHVDGNVPEHRFLEVPIGTPAADLLEAAGRSAAGIGSDEVLADGGPGWSFPIETGPGEFGVRKRSNCLLVLDEEEVDENTLGGGRINVLEERDWSGSKETEPSTLNPDRVRIPLRTNPDLDHVVDRSEPVVREGMSVDAGETIATPTGDGISNAQHASIGGEITSVTETHVAIGSDTADGSVSGRELDHGTMIYWTWCVDCGAYIARPEFEHVGEDAHYVCGDCR